MPDPSVALHELIESWEARARESDRDEYSDRSDAYRDCAQGLRAALEQLDVWLVEWSGPWQENDVTVELYATEEVARAAAAGPMRSGCMRDHTEVTVRSEQVRHSVPEERT